jgi:hypothetical protein
MKKHPPRLLVLAGLLTVSAFAAFEAGSFAYTKRVETKLYAEPKVLAASSGKLAFARKVKVDQVQGSWLHVSEGDVSGWVFSGNLSATMPDEGAKLDNVSFLASKTTASAATRGLDEDVVKYAAQRNLHTAQADLEWLQASAAEITEADVDGFLQESKKGEYQ